MRRGRSKIITIFQWGLIFEQSVNHRRGPRSWPQIGAAATEQRAPPLVPRDAVTGARTEEWISLVNTTIDPLLVRQYLLAYFFPRDPERSPDRAAIEAVLPNMEKHFAVLDRGVARTGHLVGDSFTLADMNLLPILFFMEKTPESRAMLDQSPNFRRYYDRHQARASVKDTIPPPFPGRSWEIEA